MADQLRLLAIPSRVRQERVARTVAIVSLVVLFASMPLAAQTPKVHYRYQGNEPPGAIGSMQLLRGGPLPGYFQPVEIKAPSGALISLAVDGAFVESAKAPVRVGMLIAPVYRLRVTNIPLHEGEEVFPTIEIIDRIYPPVGEVTRFPIPIELMRDDLELALEGHYITRVVYLEDPGQALPVASGGKEQEWFDTGPGTNPVEIADRLGRPVAIIRMGGRVPDLRSGADAQFFAGSPPFVPLSADCRPLVSGPVIVPAPIHTATATDEHVTPTAYVKAGPRAPAKSVIPSRERQPQ